MLANSNNNQGMSGGDWVNNCGLYRGALQSGLHFMNFPTHMALLPGQQLGSGIGGTGNVNEGHVSMLAGLNPYRPVIGVSESQASGSQSHHDGGGEDDPRENNNHHHHHS